MELQNGHGKLVAINIGGKSNPSLSLTFAFETEQADQGPFGKLFEWWPLLESTAKSVEKDRAESISTSAADLLGNKAHILRVWGLPYEDRNEHSSPLLKCDAVHLVKNLTAEVSTTEGEPALVKARLSIKAALKEFDPVLLQDLGGNLHESVWLDVAPNQTDIEDDDVAPTNRTAEQQQADQQGLDLGGEG